MKGRDITRPHAVRADDKLKRVSQADRKRMSLSKTLNRFWRRREELRAQSRVGPGCCRHCGSEPCGGAWGPMLTEESARCCARCTHEPLERFVPTHIIWYDKKAFFVRELPVGKGGSVYLRADGVAWFTRIADQHWFLGRPLTSVEFARFRVSDRNGWPAGMEAKDMGIDISKDADEAVERELEEASLEEFDEDAPEDDEVDDEGDGEDDDDEDAGEDDDSEYSDTPDDPLDDGDEDGEDDEAEYDDGD